MCQAIFYNKIKGMDENEMKNANAMENPAPRKGFRKHIRSFWEILQFAIIALVIVIPIRAFVAQPFIVSGASMVPTFKNGDYLVVDELTYAFNKPERGDVIIFKYPKDTTKFFIKRIIGLPGETIEISGSAVTIINTDHPDGFIMDEPYVKNTAINHIKAVLGDDEYFVMGDNRSASSDSRSWGTLPENLITGRAFVRLLPINNINILPGNYKNNPLD